MLSVTASNFDPDVQQVIKYKKTSLMYKLIERLTPSYSYSTNMGASQIIIDLMDDRESRDLFITLDETNLKKMCAFQQWCLVRSYAHILYSRTSACRSLLLLLILGLKST